MERNSQTIWLPPPLHTAATAGPFSVGPLPATFEETQTRRDTSRTTQSCGLRWPCWQPKGSGIFSRLHFSIDKQQKASIGARTGTHVATWAILEEWAFRNQAADLLGRILTPRDIPMSDWLNHFSPGVVWAPVAEDWLRVMGLDLKRLSAGSRCP